MPDDSDDITLRPAIEKAPGRDSDRRRIEEERARSHEMMRYIIEHNQSAVAVFDREMRYLYVSQLYLQENRIPPGDVIGRCHYDIVPDIPEKWRDVHRRVMQGEIFSADDDPYFREDGTVDYISWVCRPWYRGPEDIGGIILYTKVTTERKRKEEDERQLREQLNQAMKLESIGRLAGGVAHDFNNMLNIILVNAEFALEELPSDSPLREALEEIGKATRRSADLTRQLLTFARKQTVEPRALDLNATVEGMLKMLGRLMGENLELVWAPGAGLGAVYLDPSQLDQVLANLCLNARDAIADTGRVTLSTDEVTLTREDRPDQPDFTPGRYVRLTVSDTGCGMSARVRTHLFEPFYTTKDVGRGTGLGLATVHGIITQNRGIIDVESAPGRGTTFHIYLPRHAPEAIAAPTMSRRPEDRGLTGTETILLVEDEPEILNVARRVLERQGYRVLQAATPILALALAARRAEPVDLLLTDVIMPGMNGRELADRLRETRPDLRCLYMSGYTADIIAHRGVLDEGVFFLQKPFTWRELAQKVRRVLDA
jgi:two-component system, cell cycle sensor histidine kinase and response regulator CckA